MREITNPHGSRLTSHAETTPISVVHDTDSFFLPAVLFASMPTRFLQAATLLVFATLIVACGGTPAPSGDDVTVEQVDLDAPEQTQDYVPTLEGPLRILSATPGGQLQTLQERQPISVTFSRPMVPLGDAAPPEDALTIEPAVPGSLRWEGTQTLVYQPSKALRPATEYTVTLAPTVSDLDGNTLSMSYTWTFQTPRPQLLKSSPADGAEFAAPDDSVRLSFSLPVEAEAAQGYLEASFPVRSITNDGDSSLVVAPAGPLEQGESYTVTLKEGLPSVGYELGLSEERTMRFRVRPEPELMGLDQPQRWDEEAPFAPDRGITLLFSTPVRFGELREALSFEPEVEWSAGAEAREASEDVSHSLPVKLDPETRYTLSIRDLTDQFGQTLSVAQRSFRTGPYEPHFHMDRGMMVIEADQHAVVPLQVTNVESVRLGMERLSADEIVPALSTYDERHNYNRPEDAPTRPPVAARRTVELPVKRNTLQTVPLRLDSMLAGEAGMGVVGVRLLRPPLHEDDQEADYRALAQVTNLGITGKFSPHQNVIIVSELATGTPVEGATVTIRGDSNRVHWTGQTDAEGRVRTPGWHALGMEKPNEYDAPAQYAIVEQEGDVAFTSSRYDDGTEPYRFDVNYSWRTEAVTETGTVFSDRGLYKTGETVHLKGILRSKTDDGWQSIRDSVRVVARSPRDELVLDRRLQPSDLGTFDLDWSVPKNASLGDYRVRVGYTDDETLTAERRYEREGIATGSFQVNAFRRATFEVTARSTRDEYVAGDFFEGRVSARYLFGARMAGQPATIELERDNGSYSPPGYSGYRFGPIDTDYLGETLLREESILDSTSSVEAPRTRLPGNSQGAPAQLTWRGTVTAPSEQQISDRTTATLHPGRFYVGLKPSTSFMDLTRDSTLSVDVVTVDPNGAPVADKEVTVELVRIQWNSVREAGADGRLRWRSERTEEIVRSASVKTKPGQASRLRMMVPAGGQYRLRATSQDVRGNVIRTETYLYASGEGYVAWQRDNDDRIDLVPEKTDYAPGETARLMVQSPYEEATALITVEREGILQSRVTTLEGSTPMVEIPIKDRYLPNVYVSVILLKGRTAPPKAGSDPGAPSFKIGYASLSVDPDQKHLRVDLEADQQEYRPGEEVTVGFQLTNAAGDGVPGEIAFSAADAGVLNLIGYELPDPFDTFYGPRPLGVTTAETRGSLVEQRSYGQKAEDVGGGGTMQKSEVREDFRPLAHWDPAIQTDDDGEASITFELPQSLTTFRLMASALTDNHTFGAAQTDIVVTKPLVQTPALPRFARIGDQFSAGVLVTNRSDEAGTASISASAEGLTLRNDSTKTVQLQAGATREVRFDWTAPTAGDARLTFRARMNGETDALATTLPVKRPTTKRASATFASTEETAREALRLPEERVPGLGQFDVTLASTALVGLDGAVQHLFEYPYGCLEQTTSRIRPLLASGALLDAFDLEAFEGKSRDQAVRDWMGSLSSHWTGDGFSLWEGGAHVNPYVTAYTLMALAEVEAAGYDVPQPLTQNAIDAVAHMVRNRSDRPDYYDEDVWRDTRAFMLFALARHGEVLESEINWLASRPPTSVEGQSHLLRTLLIIDQPNLPDVQARLVEQLRQRIRVEATTAYLQAPAEDGYGWIFSSDVRATAFGLTALLEATPSEDFRQLAQRMIRYLMDRRQQGHWASTQDNAAVVTAFQRYVDAYEEETPDFAASAQLAGKTILENTFQGRSIRTAATAIEADAFPEGLRSRELPLAVSKDGTGRLYYSARLTTYTSAPQDALDQGLRVERTLQRLDSRGKAVGAPLPTGNERITLESGQLVKVTLRLSSPTSRTYVVVDDALPAGLEPINEAFVTSGEDVLEEADTGSDRWWGSFTHTEMQDDRVVLFADYLEQGEHTYSYVARATTAGTFEHPPAEAEMMYRPETRGHTATGTVVVESLQPTATAE